MLLLLRFLPTGLLVTVFVLLLRDRGLTLTQIGIGMAAQGLVMLVLELPSGGLADAVGRKPVLLVATAVCVVATSLLLVVDTVALLALTTGLMGVFRALDSGPLQAWFIDGTLRADPTAEIERDLARADVVICASIGAGALLAGGVVALDGIGTVDPLLAPVWLALMLTVVSLLGIVRLMDEPRRHVGGRAVAGSMRTVPSVIREAMAIIRASRLLTALVIAELLWGYGMVAFETLLPPRLAEVSGGFDEAARLLGPAVTAAWVLSALGAACSPWLVRRFGSGAAGCALRVLHGATVAAMGLAAGPAGLIAAYLATYWVHGATAPVHYGLVHRGVGSEHRATVVSANSLTSQLGAAAGGVSLGLLADATSISTAMLVAAAVLALAGPLYLTGRGRADPSYEVPIPQSL